LIEVHVFYGLSVKDAKYEEVTRIMAMSKSREEKLELINFVMAV